MKFVIIYFSWVITTALFSYLYMYLPYEPAFNGIYYTSAFFYLSVVCFLIGFVATFYQIIKLNDKWRISIVLLNLLITFATAWLLGYLLLNSSFAHYSIF